MKVKRIISGGQSGADLAGIKTAKEFNIPTGGHCPADFRTEKGSKPELGSLYGLVCTASESYQPRTKLNVQNSDITLIFGSSNSAGSKLTRRFCNEANKPYLLIPVVDAGHFEKVLAKLNVMKDGLVINIAGNRESKNPGIGKSTTTFLRALFSSLGHKQ